MNKPAKPIVAGGRIDLLIALRLLLLCWLVFSQTLTHPFAVVDDADYVLENARVNHGVSAAAIVWAFTHTHAANWHPLTWISHMLDCQVYSLAPWGHHFTNVLLHSTSTVLLFALLRSMTATRWPCAFVAAAFALHPLRAESVAWIAERKDVLSGFFFLLTLLCYSNYARRGFSAGRYILVLLCFAAGLMSKAMVVTLPCVLLLLDYWPLRRPFNRRVLLEKVPCVLFSAAACLPTLFAQRTAMLPLENFRLTDRFANAAVSVCVYLRQLVWPANLAAFYPFERVPLTTLALAVCLLAAITSAVWWLRRRRYLVTGWLWYLVMLLPVIGIIQVGEQAHADRYTYLPHIGLLLAIGWGGFDLAERLRIPRRALATCTITVIAGLTLLGWQEVSAWKDPERLWRRTIARTPDNPTSRTILANALYKKRQLEPAVSEFRRSLELREAQPRVHSNLAGVLLDLGRASEAYDHLKRALQLNPEEADALSNLGLLALDSGDAAASAAYLEQAIKAKPDFADAHYNYGNTLMQLGRPFDAVAQFEKAIQLNPRDEQALNNVAWLLATWPDDSVRNGNKAVEYARRADEITSHRNAMIVATLAAAYAEAGEMEEAVKSAQQAAELARSNGNTSLATAITGQLEQYHRGAPWRDPRFATPKS